MALAAVLRKCLSRHLMIHRGHVSVCPRLSCFPSGRRMRPAYQVCSATGHRPEDSPLTQALAAATALEAAGLSLGSIATLSEAVQASSTPCNLRCILGDVPGSQADALAETLLCFGALSTSVEEYRPAGAVEQEIYNEGQGREVWERCTVIALFDIEADVPEALHHTESTLETGKLEYRLECVADQEWEEAIKASYQPVQVSKGLWIVPSWCEPPEPNALNIRMEPGLAFGTGEHATTRLCLRFLQSLDLAGQCVVDYGTGSGVLAIAALQMGASQAAGTDTDPLSIKAAMQNAVLNGVDDRFHVHRCEPTAAGPNPLAAEPSLPGQFDICIANILRGPLLELMPRLASYVKPGGTIALSGILTGQAATVEAAYSQHFTDMKMESEGDWALLTGRKRADAWSS